MQKHPEMMVVRQPWDTGSSAREDPYTELAITVVMTAVEDYIEILKTMLKGDLTDNEIHDCKLEKRRLEKFFRSKDYEFYTAFMSTEIDPEDIIKLCPIRAKERLEEEIRKAEEKAKEVAEKTAKKASKEQAEKSAKEDAEQQGDKHDNTENNKQDNNNNSSADKAESEDAQ